MKIIVYETNQKILGSTILLPQSKNRARHYTKRVAFWEYVKLTVFSIQRVFSRQYLLNATNERKPSKAAEENREEHILRQLKYTLKKL